MILIHRGRVQQWLAHSPVIAQKPSWWNRPQRSCRKRVQANGANAADDRARKTRRGLQAKKGKRAPTVKENFALTRSRYTILTAVPHGWKMSDHEADVPLCAMLFKGKPGGNIYEKLERRLSKERPHSAVRRGRGGDLSADNRAHSRGRGGDLSADNRAHSQTLHCQTEIALL